MVFCRCNWNGQGDFLCNWIMMFWLHVWDGEGMGCCSVNRREGKVGKGGIDCVLVVHDHKGKGLGVHVSDDVLTKWLGGEGAWVLLSDSKGGRQWLCPIVTLLGGEGVGCYSVMISSRNWGVFLKSCVFTYIFSAVITVFNVNPVVFLIFFYH